MIKIRKANPEDAGQVFNMAKQLAQAIGDGDGFCCTQETLARYGFGEHALFHSLIAHAESEACGLAMYSPVFSTNKGVPGVYVSDLWATENWRGQKLGKKLLAAVAQQAWQAWGANYMVLVVYEDNPAAMRFYQCLGFVGNAREKRQMLQAGAFQNLLAGKVI